MRKSLFRRLVALAILIVLSIVAIVIGVTVLSSTAGGIILTFMGGFGLASGLVMGVMMLAHESARKKNIKILQTNIDRIQTVIDEADSQQETLEMLKATLLTELELVYPRNNLRSPTKESPTGTVAEQKPLATESPRLKPSMFERIFLFFKSEEDLLEILRKKERGLRKEKTKKIRSVLETSLEVELVNKHLEELDRPELKNVKNIMPWRDRLLSRENENRMVQGGEIEVPETKLNLEDHGAHDESRPSSSENQTESSANRSLGL